jgi:hypothetical protein
MEGFDLSTVQVSLGPLFPYALTILTALVGMIVVRKAVKLTNRS